MMILVNPHAGGGSGLRRWREVERELLGRKTGFRSTILYDEPSLERVVSDCLRCGERQFAAAGGDGTVSALLQVLLRLTPEDRHPDAVLGAIGLGSSNDFHKPFQAESMIAGFPCAINFSSARLRDVGKVVSSGLTGETSRYFLINASAGLTAEANRYFNRPKAVLPFLKRHWTSAAIALAAMRTVFRYRDIDLTLSLDDMAPRQIPLSNLALVKSPHVSGSLRYPCEPGYDSGYLELFLARKLSRFERVCLLASLTLGTANESAVLERHTSSRISLSSPVPFAVEFDGEIITASRASFTVLPRHLQVCTC